MFCYFDRFDLARVGCYMIVFLIYHCEICSSIVDLPLRKGFGHTVSDGSIISNDHVKSNCDMGFGF